MGWKSTLVSWEYTDLCIGTSIRVHGIWLDNESVLPQILSCLTFLGNVLLLKRDRSSACFHPPRASDCDMEGCRVGDGDLGSAGDPCNACRAHCHLNTRHLESCRRRADARRFDLWRIDLIRTVHEHFCNPWIGVIRVQVPRTAKRVGFRCLSRANGDTGAWRGTSIVHSIEELDH